MSAKPLKFYLRQNLLRVQVEKEWLHFFHWQHFFDRVPRKNIDKVAITDADQRDDPRFSMHEKRELLDLLNEKARKHQDSVSLVAEALGKTAEVKDTCDVSFKIYLWFL